MKGMSSYVAASTTICGEIPGNQCFAKRAWQRVRTVAHCQDCGLQHLMLGREEIFRRAEIAVEPRLRSAGRDAGIRHPVVITIVDASGSPVLLSRQPVPV
jgi:hypothetical protein